MLVIYSLGSNKSSSIFDNSVNCFLICNHWRMIAEISLFPTLEVREISIKNIVDVIIAFNSLSDQFLKWNLPVDHLDQSI